MEEVRRLRRERDWTQTELAFHAGLAPSVISEIETGKRDPSAGTLKKLAGALEVSVGELFPGKVQASLFEEDEPEQRRSPFMEAWTSYAHRRAQEWEDVLPERARVLRPTVSLAADESVPTEEFRGLTEELAAKPELTSELLLRNEMVYSEFAAVSRVLIEAEQVGRNIGAPEMVAPGSRRRAAYLEHIDAREHMVDVVKKWAVVEKAARAAGSMSESPEELARARERQGERQKVVALFERLRSA